PVDEDQLLLHRLVAELEAHDDDLLALPDEVRRRAVHLDRAGAARRLDDVRLQTGAGRIADYEHLLADHESGSLDEVHVDGDAAHVIHAGPGDGGLMDLRAEEETHVLARVTGWGGPKSISRRRRGRA